MAIFRDGDILGLEYAQEFTKAYKKGTKENIFIRESICEDVQFPRVLVSPRTSDLLCGKRLFPEVGYSPQVGGMGYYFNSSSWKGENPKIKYSPGELKEWRILEEFWSIETTTSKCVNSLPSEIKIRLSGEYSDEGKLDHPAYALYRMSGLQLDLKKLVREGVPGLEREVLRYKNNSSCIEANDFYQSAFKSVQRIKICIQHFVTEAKRLPQSRKSNKMISALSGLLNHAPETFHEGLQLVLLIQVMTGVINFGRLDTVLGSFLSNDLDSGRIDWEEALELMQNFYAIIEEEILHFDGRIIIGGKGRENEAAADKFAMLAMETTDSLDLPMPQLSLRFYQGQNPKLLEKALDVVGRSKTFPMLYNDDINIPAVQKAFGIDLIAAEQYTPFGCGEYMIENRSCDTPNFIINLQMCLELAMNNGSTISEDRHFAPDHGSISEFETFEQLWNAYSQTVNYFLEVGAQAQSHIYQVTAKECPFSLISLLYDRCLQRGQTIFDGGIEFLGGTNETYGNNNTSDSLTAIDELIYKSGIYTGDQLLAALKSNWEGYENMRVAFQKAPKFGNDDEVADRMQSLIHKQVCTGTIESARDTGLHHFLVVIINNNHNTIWGKYTSASADGRRNGEPLAPGNSAGAGNDKNGLTALLNSQTKANPAIHAGAVQNVRLSSHFPSKETKLYHALINSYFNSGGTQLMVTVTNRQDLVAALETPGKYANLLVRVGGFSARFIDLDKATQLEILSRTEY